MRGTRCILNNTRRHCIIGGDHSLTTLLCLQCISAPLKTRKLAPILLRAGPQVGPRSPLGLGPVLQLMLLHDVLGHAPEAVVFLFVIGSPLRRRHADDPPVLLFNPANTIKQAHPTPEAR